MLNKQSKQISVESRHIFPCTLSILIVVDAMQIHKRRFPILQDYIWSYKRMERKKEILLFQLHIEGAEQQSLGDLPVITVTCYRKYNTAHSGFTFS